MSNQGLFFTIGQNVQLGAPPQIRKHARVILFAFAQADFVDAKPAEARVPFGQPDLLFCLSVEHPSDRLVAQVHQSAHLCKRLLPAQLEYPLRLPLCAGFARHHPAWNIIEISAATRADELSDPYVQPRFPLGDFQVPHLSRMVLVDQPSPL